MVKIVVTEKDIPAVQRHLKDVIEGAAFKGSHRSGQFLKYIVDQAITGHFESLKERVIGVELFGRSPSYNTGDDAIVRVTASDVRKRLVQHYRRYGVTSEFRISLPLGSYIPEISHELYDQTSLPHTDKVVPQEPTVTPHEDSMLRVEPMVLSEPSVAPPSEASDIRKSRSRQWIFLGLLIATLNLAVWAIFWSLAYRRANSSSSVLPWSVLFNPAHATQLITSDPNIVEIQGYTGEQISVSDYANHNYIPDPKKLSPEVQQFCRIILRGDKAAAVDTPIAVSIAELAQASSHKINVHAARNIQLADLQNDDNFIFLGSPRSNPWSALFNDQLDFKFFFDKASGQEIIRNAHPVAHELSEYVPTAVGWATGQSYAIIALVRNPDQNGQVLLLGGANGEGTEAAGKLATDLPRLATALQRCDIPHTGTLQHFELLLRVNTMAGSPTKAEVEACHILHGSSPR